jgi:hypothetical protein
MGIFFPLLALAISVLPASAQLAGAALTGDRTLQSPSATDAQRRYMGTLQQARTTYASELEPALKAAMTAGSLDEANAINELKKSVEAGGMPATAGQNFKTGSADGARSRFEKAVVAAQRQYAVDLNQALKAAMAAGQLNEANAINGELKALGEAALVPTVAVAAATPAPLGAATAGRSAQGLLLTRYPMHPSQKDGNKYAGYVPLADLGKPIGAPRTVPTVSGWTKQVDENAVVAGLLRIDQRGTYQFRTSSGYDRNELLLDGKVVCKFRDGENKVATVELRIGLLPIVSVGYAHSTTEVRVQWKPPGATDFSDLPSNLFSH